MIHINPILYQYLCSTTSSLVTLPIDIAQTKILSTKEVNTDLSEIKWLLLFPLIFTTQNIVYNELYNIKSTMIRGAIAGFLTSPIYTFLETKKMYKRLNILPRYETYFKIILVRQTIFYSILYKISKLNIAFSNFISAIVANLVGFPLKLLALSKSYSIFLINKKTIKLCAVMVILKASISDGLSLYLMYSPNFSPLKKI
jgi:hypothetical protein